MKINKFSQIMMILLVGTFQTNLRADVPLPADVTESTLNGNICRPLNLNSGRERHGVEGIRNSSGQYGIDVVCPLVDEFSEHRNAGATISIQNYGNDSYNNTCTLYVISPAGKIIASASAKAAPGPDRSAIIKISSISTVSISNFLSVRCNLAPKVKLSEIKVLKAAKAFKL